MVTIRPGKPEHAPAVRRVHETAFTTPAEADLVDRLRATGRAAVSLVAQHGDAVIGHILFSPVTFDPPNRVVALGLAPMAVLPGHEKHAVGRRLVQNGLAECHARGACLVVVLGDPAYYGRFGFERASRHSLRNEFGVEDEFMVFMLEASAHPVPGTLVKYAPEFSALPKITSMKAEVRRSEPGFRRMCLRTFGPANARHVAACQSRCTHGVRRKFSSLSEKGRMKSDPPLRIYGNLSLLEMAPSIPHPCGPRSPLFIRLLPASMTSIRLTRGAARWNPERHGTTLERERDAQSGGKREGRSLCGAGGADTDRFDGS